MRRFVFCLIAILLSPSAVAAKDMRAVKDMHGPFAVTSGYGDPAPYRDGIHAGIDYGIDTGTPVIAVTKGKVVFIKDFGPDGWEVSVGHANQVRSLYIHLSKVLVGKGQFVKRGEVVGLSGESNSWNAPHYAHLHFGIGKIGVSTENFSGSLDPGQFWLDGKPQCFDPGMDYSSYPQNAFTLPLPCGEYAKELVRTLAAGAK